MAPIKQRKIKALVIHTTASRVQATSKDIMNYFFRVLKWSRGGYNVMINRDGTLYRPYAWNVMTNGIGPSTEVGLSNSNTIHVSYLGGISEEDVNDAVCNITLPQEKMLLDTIQEVILKYPDIIIVGHNQLSNAGKAKACPSFWVPDWLRANKLGSYAREYDIWRQKRQIVELPHPANFYSKPFEERVI